MFNPLFMGISDHEQFCKFAMVIFTELQNFQYPCFSDSSVGFDRQLLGNIHENLKTRK